MTKFVLLGLFLLVGCQQNSKPSLPDESNIVYFKDSRTGVCFAALNSATYTNFHVTSITAVPCDALARIQEK
jgi:hypothetical protein